MSETPTPMEAHPEPELYEIRVRGHLDARWVSQFDGLTITLEENGDTLLIGPVIDQAALHGLLKKVRDLGMSLVSVIPVQFNETHSYHSKKGEKMNTDKTAKNLLDVRIILAVLWVAGMLSSLNGDTYRLSAMTKPFGVSSELLTVFAVVLVGHVFMSGLTLTLKSSVSRWANRIMSIFYAMITLAFEVLHFIVWRSAGYEIVWATAQLVFALLVVWYAWKWPNPEG